MGFKNFKRLLISIQKCKELNSESKPQIDFGLGPHPGPKPIFRISSLRSTK